MDNIPAVELGCFFFIISYQVWDYNGASDLCSLRGGEKGDAWSTLSILLMCSGPYLLWLLKRRRKQMFVLECSIPRHTFRRHTARKKTQHRSHLCFHFTQTVPSDSDSADSLVLKTREVQISILIHACKEKNAHKFFFLCFNFLA